MNNATLNEIAGELHIDELFLPQHQHIFKAILGIAQRQVAAGQAPAFDLVILTEELQQLAKLDAAGGAPYLASLVDGVPRVSNAQHYMAIVKEKAALRRLIHLTHNIQQRAFDGRDGEDESTQALYDSAIQSIQSASPKPKQMIVGGNGRLSYSVDEFLQEQFPAPEHLIEWIAPKSGSALVIAKPHHLKSWYTLALGLLATRDGDILGRLPVHKPIRTLLISVEDFPGETQQRMNLLLQRDQFQHVDRALFRIFPRPIGGIDIMQEAWYQRVLKEIDKHKADLVIFDVLRRIFAGDINSPKEAAGLCERFECIRDVTGVAVMLVHHENRKEADIMSASAGSFNIPGWANSVIRFQRKTDEVIAESKVSTVEIEVDNKFAPNSDPVRMVLDLAAENPIRLEDLEDASGLAELREQLGSEWTVNDLAQVLTVHPSNAKRRLKKMIAADLVEKVTEGRRGRHGGLARFHFVGEGD